MVVLALGHPTTIKDPVKHGENNEEDDLDVLGLLLPTHSSGLSLFRPFSMSSFTMSFTPHRRHRSATSESTGGERRLLLRQRALLEQKKTQGQSFYRATLVSALAKSSTPQKLQTTRPKR